MAQKQATPYPLRMPPGLRTALEERATENSRSLNAEIVSLLEQGLIAASANTPLKIINRDKQGKRIIYGSLLNAFDIDFNQDLDELKTDIETTLDFLKKTRFHLKLAFMVKNIYVFQGHNHLDIINDGVGSVGWLTVEDHLV